MAAAALVDVGEELPNSEEPAASDPNLASLKLGSKEPADADPALASLAPGTKESANAGPDLAIPDTAVVVGETSLDSVEASPGGRRRRRRLLPHPTPTFSHALLDDSRVCFLLLLGAPNLCELDLHRILVDPIRLAHRVAISDGEPLQLNEILPNPEQLGGIGGVGGGV